MQLFLTPRASRRGYLIIFSETWEYIYSMYCMYSRFCVVSCRNFDILFAFVAFYSISM